MTPSSKTIVRQHRGQCVLIRPDEDLNALLGRLGRLVTTPAVTDLQFPSGWETAVDPLPDLYEGKPPAHCSEAHWRGYGTLRAVPKGIPIPRLVVPTLRKSVGSPPLGPTTPRGSGARMRLPECVTLARGIQPALQGTAFVAWDEQEKAVIATESMWQPSLDPFDGYVGHSTGVLSALGEASRMAWDCVRKTRLQGPLRFIIKNPRRGLLVPIVQLGGSAHSGIAIRSFRNLAEANSGFLDRWLAGKDGMLRESIEQRLSQWLDEITALQLPSPGQAFSGSSGAFANSSASGIRSTGSSRGLCRKMGW